MKNVLKVMAIAIVLFLSVAGKVNAQTTDAAQKVPVSEPVKKVSAVAPIHPVATKIAEPAIKAIPETKAEANTKTEPMSAMKTASVTTEMSKATAATAKAAPEANAIKAQASAPNPIVWPVNNPPKPIDINSEVYKSTHLTANTIKTSDTTKVPK